MKEECGKEKTLHLPAYKTRSFFLFTIWKMVGHLIIMHKAKHVLYKYLCRGILHLHECDNNFTYKFQKDIFYKSKIAKIVMVQ